MYMWIFIEHEVETSMSAQIDWVAEPYLLHSALARTDISGKVMIMTWRDSLMTCCQKKSENEASFWLKHGASFFHILQTCK